MYLSRSYGVDCGVEGQKLSPFKHLNRRTKLRKTLLKCFVCWNCVLKQHIKEVPYNVLYDGSNAEMG